MANAQYLHKEGKVMTLALLSMYNFMQGNDMWGCPSPSVRTFCIGPLWVQALRFAMSPVTPILIHSHPRMCQERKDFYKLLDSALTHVS